MRIFIIIFLFVALVGCNVPETQRSKEYNESIAKQRQQAIDACIEAGGIPILSIWDGRLKDCIFPPDKKCQEK